MAVNEDMAVFVGKVKEMRRIQKEFFRTRSFAAMQLAKSLEKDVDDRADRLQRQLEELDDGNQLDLFEVQQ